jgi:C4-dicarboxylate transporter DctM subunit
VEILLVLTGLIVLLLTGLPIFAGLSLAAIAILYFTQGEIGSLGDVVFGKLNVYLLVAIPLFAFMAHLMIRTRVVDDLYATAHTLLRHLPGGLGAATVASCTLFAAISGSSVATALTVGTTAIPQMIRYRYPPHAAYGVVAAGGTLGILIPPSGPMILYAVVSGTSIGALFIGGLLPGLLVAFLFAVYAVLSRRGVAGEERGPRAGIGEILSALRRSIWALLLPALVLGGMYFGVFTATEAAAAGAIAALAIAVLVYRDMTFAKLFDAALAATRTTAMLFMILAGAAMLSHVLTILRLPAELLEAVTALGIGPVPFLITVMALIVVLGMFLETISIILVTTPIVMPVLDGLGVNPVWYGILLMINLELALITPPVGMNLFVIKGITDAPIREIVRGTLPYVLLMALGLAIVFAFPDLVLWLPGTMNYGR